MEPTWPAPTWLADEASLQALVSGFEKGTWPHAEWRHPAHLAVASCYVLDGDPSTSQAMDLLRTRISWYNESLGNQNTADSGYHETITRFWCELVTRFVSPMRNKESRLEIVRAVVREFGDRRDLFQQYYDFDIVKSREARAAWIPPTLAPTPVRPSDS